MSFQFWRNIYHLNQFYSLHQTKYYYFKFAYKNTIIRDILFKNYKTMYPETDNSTCTAILLTNLADPEWINIQCDELITTDVLCYFQKDNNLKVSVKGQSEIFMYNKSCVLKNNTCYLFKWIEITNTDDTGQYISNVELFQFLFEAVSVNFPPLLVPHLKLKITYQRYGSIFIYRKTEGENFDGLVIQYLKY